MPLSRLDDATLTTVIPCTPQEESAEDQPVSGSASESGGDCGGCGWRGGPAAEEQLDGVVRRALKCVSEEISDRVCDRLRTELRALIQEHSQRGNDGAAAFSGLPAWAEHPLGASSTWSNDPLSPVAAPAKRAPWDPAWEPAGAPAKSAGAAPAHLQGDAARLAEGNGYKSFCLDLKAPSKSTDLHSEDSPLLGQWQAGHRRGYLAADELTTAVGDFASVHLGYEDSEIDDDEAEASSARPWGLGSVACSVAASSRPAGVREKLPLCSYRRCKRFAAKIVCSAVFDYTIGTLILASAALIGLQTEYMSNHIGEDIPLSFRLAELIFASVFAVELSLRLFVAGRRFFTMPGWQWNLLDFVIVGVQVVEVAMTNLGGLVMSRSTLLLRVVRIMRLLRVMRVVRILHLIGELRTMAGAICCALRPFLWMLLLLVLMIYILAIYFMQIIIEHYDEEPAKFTEDPTLQKYWSSLSVAILSLFQSIMGGVDWENMVDPLMKNISPGMAVLFSIYVAFASLVMLSLITGIFFDLTFNSIRDTKDRELVNQVKELFERSDANGSGRISFEEFQCQLKSPLMEAYFKVIDLDLSEAKGLFHLLDTSGRGHVEAQDFVMGCMRLRGPARAIDLAMLDMRISRDSRRIFSSLHSVGMDLQRHIGALSERMAAFSSRNIAPASPILS
mmetsp:Transcript_118065/g.252223  ORF Transcript_118065/g.252223 Transcript_118065/m.252223 type:complete len:675 (-) Transcript_118065:90-2114(-)